MTRNVIDSWEVTRDEITYRIELEPDDEANSGDITRWDESLTPADVAAHKRGDWEYAGVIVTPVIGGQPVTRAADSLWKVQVGTNPAWASPRIPGGHVGREYITIMHPVPGMIPEVRENLAKLSRQINRVLGR